MGVQVAWQKHQQLVLFPGVRDMHLLDDQEHNIYHIALVVWLPSHFIVDQWLAASQRMSTL